MTSSIKPYMIPVWAHLVRVEKAVFENPTGDQVEVPEDYKTPVASYITAVQ